jgi:hypothetical protein
MKINIVKRHWFCRKESGLKSKVALMLINTGFDTSFKALGLCSICHTGNIVQSARVTDITVCKNQGWWSNNKVWSSGMWGLPVWYYDRTTRRGIPERSNVRRKLFNWYLNRNFRITWIELTGSELYTVKINSLLEVIGQRIVQPLFPWGRSQKQGNFG